MADGDDIVALERQYMQELRVAGMDIVLPAVARPPPNSMRARMEAQAAAFFRCAHRLCAPPRPAMDGNMIPVAQMQNVVATMKFVYADGSPVSLLNLYRFVMEHPETGASISRRFPAVTLRFAVPKATLLIFPTAQAVCTGTKSEMAARKACGMAAHVLRRCGIPLYAGTMVVQTMVFAVWTGFPVDLVRLNDHMGAFSSYDPGRFPGLQLKRAIGDISFTVFNNGKILIAGARTADAALEAYRLMHENILLRFWDSATPGEGVSAAIYNARNTRQRHHNPASGHDVLAILDGRDASRATPTDTSVSRQ